VNNVDERNFHNTYDKPVRNERAGNNVSYNGGTGGTTARASAAEETAGHERHIPATAAQTGHQKGRQRQPRIVGVRESWQAANRRNIQTGRVYRQGCGGSQGCCA